MISTGAKVRYKLSGGLQGVRLQPHHGSSLPDPTDELVEIPTDSIVETDGRSGSAGLISIVWNGAAFSVLEDELHAKGTILPPPTT